MAAIQHTVLVIGGPTASGKSGLALFVAAAKNGVIVNADSMQMYDGLGILTAQPPDADLSAAPHRLYAALQPDDICSAARWRDMALAEIDRVIAAGKLPVIVGGTGFYIRTLLSGISPVPEIAADIRDRLNARQKEIGNPAFHAELQKRDPVMAEKLNPYNTQRLVRAMEVLEGTGKSLAEWQALPPAPPPAYLTFVTATLVPPREKLYANCDARFGIMLKQGALEQVREFMKTATAAMPLAKALGYPELSSHLAGNISLTDAISLAQQSTRNYAKRQTTWFRNQMTPDIALDAPDAAKILPFL